MKAHDVHAHIGIDSVYGFSQKPEELIRKMDRAKIAKAVVFPFANVSKIERQNDLVAEAVRASKERLVGFCCVDPKRLGAVDEIDRAVEKLEMKGIMLDAEVFYINLKAPYMKGVFEKALEHKLPVLIHSRPMSSVTFRLGEGIDYVAQNYPEVTILTHIQVPYLGLLASRNNNIMIETSMNLDNRAIETFVSKFGADRIIFGSDSPLNHPYVKRIMVEEAEITEDQKELILRRNVKKLLEI